MKPPRSQVPAVEPAPTRRASLQTCNCPPDACAAADGFEQAGIVCVKHGEPPPAPTVPPAEPTEPAESWEVATEEGLTPLGWSLMNLQRWQAALNVKAEPPPPSEPAPQGDSGKDEPG